MMMKYKVLAPHIGDRPHDPYVPGTDDEPNYRIMEPNDARALVELGLIEDTGEEADAEEAGTVDGNETVEVPKAKLREYDEAYQALRSQLDMSNDQIADLTGKLNDADEKISGLTLAGEEKDKRIGELEAQIAALPDGSSGAETAPKGKSTNK